MKYADIYLKGYADLRAVSLGLTEYFLFYDEDRPHMALSNKAPVKVYRTRLGGGALIVDKYRPAVPTPSQPAASGQRCSAAVEAVAIVYSHKFYLDNGTHLTEKSHVLRFYCESVNKQVQPA